MFSINVKRKAKDDLQSFYLYLQQADGNALADRFLESAEATLQFLAEFPGSGSLYQSRSRRLQDIRRWAISGFPNHTIYYRWAGLELTILRVLHAAQNVGPLLKDEI